MIVLKNFRRTRITGKFGVDRRSFEIPGLGKPRDVEMTTLSKKSSGDVLTRLGDMRGRLNALKLRQQQNDIGSAYGVKDDFSHLGDDAFVREPTSVKTPLLNNRTL